jgi:regulatory protein
MNDEEKKALKIIEERAVYLLEMREYGSKELVQKLNQKFAYLSLENLPPLVDFVVLKCQEKGYLSDERYIEAFIRNALEKGQGFYKIKQTLQLKTDAEELVLTYLDIGEEEWIELAKNVLAKKYGEDFKSNSSKEQAKKMRFLQSRGFSQEQIWKAFK